MPKGVKKSQTAELREIVREQKEMLLKLQKELREANLMKAKADYAEKPFYSEISDRMGMAFDALWGDYTNPNNEDHRKEAIKA